ncbi:hypothetical protein K1T71_006096 [Dendrolimus kikuchii]|uniref:Uncharacterized protein n=1 Tax=Dendrolimus kikuchii TaxID=765133 RepID=A0ACC1D3V3_9NEOP|nr:hypothetical protein K1T71_006096 [Dendrolimus kikuchii]
MPNCSVFCCKKRSATSNLQKDGVTFHLFPKDPVLKRKWKSFCNNKPTWVPTKNSVVCSEHFKSSDFQALSNNRRKLIIGAIPTLKSSCLCSAMCQLKSERRSSNDASQNGSPTPGDTPSIPQYCQLKTERRSSNDASQNRSPTPGDTLTSIQQYTVENPPEEVLSARERRMLYKLDFQRKKIKRLQATILYLKKKVVKLQESLQNHDENILGFSLVMIEEARAINGWESIKDYIRDEKYSRSIDDKAASVNPLKNTSTEELNILIMCYETFTPYVRALFISIAILQLLWDIMLVSTILYYHIMVEKFISGVVAILTWFVTYRVWYTIPNVWPNMPGEGLFRYNRDKPATSMPVHRKRISSTNGKHFMGMPIGKTHDTVDASNEDTR